MEIVRTVTANAPVETVFAYLSDFTTTMDWDPGTVRTTRVSGDGTEGSHYRNISRFLGRQTELTYVVEQYSPASRFRIRGENATVVAHDTMTFDPTPSGGTQLTYRAKFEFKGLARFVAPLLAPALKRLGDGAEDGLRTALGRL